MFASEGDPVNVGRQGPAVRGERRDGAPPRVRGDDAATGVARRLQARLDRHLWLLDRMRAEQLHPEPPGLPELLETSRRMRRDTESLLLLCGQDPGVRVAAPRRLSDLLGDAASAAEEPRRVDARPAPAATVGPAASVELLHVVTELLDHVAACYPGARLELSSRIEARGIIVDVAVEGAARHDPDGLGGRRAAAAAEQLAQRSQHGIALRRPPAGPPPTGNGLVASVHCPPVAVTVERPPPAPAAEPLPARAGSASSGLDVVQRGAAQRRDLQSSDPQLSGPQLSDAQPSDAQRRDAQRRDAERGDPLGIGAGNGHRGDPPGGDPHRSDSFGGDSFGSDSFGSDPLGSDPLGVDPLGIGTGIASSPSLSGLRTGPGDATGSGPRKGTGTANGSGNGAGGPGLRAGTGNGAGNGTGPGNGAGNGHRGHGLGSPGAPPTLGGPSAPAYSPSASSQVDELFGPLLDLPLEPIDDRYATPIFEAIASAWFREDAPEPAADQAGVGAAPAAGGDPLNWESANDSEWRAAAARAARSEPAPPTANGLPRRRPGNQLVPPPRSQGANTSGGAGERVPDRVRERLSTYQRGLRQGRHRAPGEEGTEPEPW